MIISYLKMSVRMLLKRKVFTVINIGGLAMGMAACLALFYYVAYEFSYDGSFTDSEYSYRLYFQRDQDGQRRTYFYLATALKERLKNTPGIEDLFRLLNIDYQNNSLIHDYGAEKKVFQQNGISYADAAIGDFLGLKMVEGSFRPMRDPMKMVVTKEIADKFFAPGKATGKRLQVSGNLGVREYEIVGVIEDMPLNTHFSFHVLLSMPSLDAGQVGNSDSRESWNAQFYIKSRLPLNRITNAIERETQDYFSEDKESRWQVKALPLEDYYLTIVKDDGTIDKSSENTLWGLVVLGIFIIGIAWINFVNLSTARAAERAKEVGIRKTLGSNKNELRIQFMLESLIVNLLAAVLAFTLVQLSMPFLQRVGNPMIIPERMELHFWLWVAGLLLCGSLLSGWYPAFVLSAFNPAYVLKGKMSGKTSGISLRKGLVVLQFVASTAMIISTLVVYQQIIFMKNTALGVNIDNIMVLDAPPGSLNGDNRSFFRSVNAFKEEVAQLNFVEKMTTSSFIPGNPVGWNSLMRRPHETEDHNRNVMLIACDQDFLATYGLELVAGRFYEAGDDTFGKGSFVINEQALELFGFESAGQALGQKLLEREMFPELTIIGVVKNFHQQSLKNKIEPCGFVLSVWSNHYSLALNLDHDLLPERKALELRSGILDVKEVWKKFFPEAPFDYSFLDQEFNEQYRSDQEFSSILGVFTILAILIASSGLMGLSSYSVSQRTKEIGVRKVLGASLDKLFILLSREYFMLILIASVIAIPIAFFGVRQWLLLYPYRTNVTWWMMLSPVFLVLAVAASTISAHIFRAAVRNPVESLRYE